MTTSVIRHALPRRTDRLATPDRHKAYSKAALRCSRRDQMATDTPARAMPLSPPVTMTTRPEIDHGAISER